MTDFVIEVAERIASEGRLSIRKGEITAIEAGDPTLYTIDGRPMPMVEPPTVPSVGDVCVFFDGADPFALPPFDKV